jgi:peroxiredoxin
VKHRALPLLSLLALTACSSTSQNQKADAVTTTADVAAKPASGTKGNAPDFTLPTLDGKNVSLSDYTGKVVLVDFWSTTCNPCLEEMPHLVEMYEKYKAKGFIILAVAGDGPETRSNVSSVVHQKKMSFPVLMDEETTVISRYNPKKDMPFWVLIDKTGNIVKKKNGYDPGDETRLAADIESLLQ